MKLDIGPQAQAEANDAFDWYERRHTGLGSEFRTALRQAFTIVADDPMRHPLVPGIRQVLGIRRYRMRRFPYNVVYAIESDRVMVVAVAHAKRRPLYWRKRLE